MKAERRPGVVAVRELSVDEARREMLAVLCELRSFCSAHGLSFWLGYGSLLGAVRHGGFIPWDDDIDVCMPRADYERLLEICRRSPPPNTELVHYLVGGHAGCFYFAKLKRSGTSVRTPEGVKPWGIGVDIFPMDVVRPGAVSLVNTARWLLGTGLYPRVPRRRYIAKRIVVGTADLVGRARLTRAVLALAGARDSRGVMVAGPEMGRRGVFLNFRIEPDRVFPLGAVRFEDETFPAPRDPDLYLTTLYGNYRRIPPEHERRTHEVTYLMP